MTAQALDHRREPEHRRTLQKVRRKSLIAGGDWEWRMRIRLSRGELRDLYRAAELYEEKGLKARRKGAENGPLGYIALKLLKLICNLANRHKGIVTWSIASLARALGGHSESAIHAAKERLRAHGFLTWIRRYVETDGPGHQRGPQVEQTSNLYGLALPAAARKLLGVFGKAPGPVDDEARRQEAEQTREAQAKADSPLAHALDRLGAAVAGRLSTGGT